MEIDYRMNIYVPFEFCEKCNKIKPTKYIKQNYCEYMEICKNTVELMTTEIGEKYGKKNK